MKFYSTNNSHLKVNFKQAVIQGLAEDKGLFMPEYFPEFSTEFIRDLRQKSLHDIAFEVARLLVEDEIEKSELKRIIEESLNFVIPLTHIHDNISTLELFHGPTLAFKDVGARFMARTLEYFLRGNEKEANVLVATSGDTGSAVANGFYKVPGIKVTVLYPKGKVSNLQEKQFTTLGENIQAVEIEGNFDDCQRLVKEAFLDTDIKSKLMLTSANSINLARLIPQSFYYIWGFAQIKDVSNGVVFSVPSGNFGNLTAGLFAKKMGLPVKNFIAATNVNDVVPEYLITAEYNPRPSIATIANAMDVGDPSNFARILDLYKHSHGQVNRDIIGIAYTDDEIRETIRTVYDKFNYVLDPHGAVGYRALANYLRKRDTQGIFIETAHPAKFTETVNEQIGKDVDIPDRLKDFLCREKKAISLSADFSDFKNYLLTKS